MASKFISSIKDLFFGKGPVERENLTLPNEIENLPLPNEMLAKIFSYLDIKVRFCQKILLFCHFAKKMNILFSRTREFDFLVIFKAALAK